MTCVMVSHYSVVDRRGKDEKRVASPNISLTLDPKRDFLYKEKKYLRCCLYIILVLFFCSTTIRAATALVSTIPSFTRKDEAKSRSTVKEEDLPIPFFFITKGYGIEQRGFLPLWVISAVLLLCIHPSYRMLHWILPISITAAPTWCNKGLSSMYVCIHAASRDSQYWTTHKG